MTEPSTPAAMTLMLGDCLERMREIPDGSVDMILCDLPYGTTACSWDTVIPFEPLWEQYKRIVKPKSAIVLFGSQPFTTDLIMSNRKWFRYEWIWDKAISGNPLLAKIQPMKIHENICVFSGDPTNYYPIMTIGKIRKRGGGFSKLMDMKMAETISDQYYPPSIISVPNGVRGEHPTQKPVALCEYLIRTYTNEGETVLDNTMGSGTTGVACAHTGRNFIGIEKDETYFNIAKQRIEGAQLPLC